MNYRTNSTFLLEFFLWLRALLTFVPATAEYSPMVINVGTVFMVYVLLIANVEGRLIEKTFLRFLPLYLIAIVNVMWGYKSGTLFTFIYGIMQWMIWPIAVSYLIKEKKYKVANRLYILSSLLILYTAVTTYYGNETIPGASRALAAIWSKDTETAHVYRQLNIGGFEFVYLLTLMVSLWIYVIRAKAEKWLFLLSAISIVVSFATIIKTEYTTALLFSLAGIALLVLPRNLTTKHLIFYIAVFAAFVIIGGSFVSTLFIRVAHTTESAVFAERFSGLSDYIMGSSLEGDAGTRQEVMVQSWNAFIQNPLTGSPKVGGHSLILDTMGRFGIWGIMLLCIVFGRLYKICVRPQKGTLYYGYLLFIYICQIGLALLNTTIIFDFFLIIAPLIGLITREQKKQIIKSYSPQ